MADVLIAEDDADIREWVALALTKAHYQVRTVADGAAALVAYAERRPDILILDIMMPRKSGFDVCEELRTATDCTCTFGHEGGYQIVTILGDICSKKGKPGDIALLRDLAPVMQAQALCGEGRALAGAVLQALDLFGPEIEAHITRKSCISGGCPAFKTYHILVSKCTGCGKCLKACDDGAIMGKAKFVHVIDQRKCIQCDQCRQACPEGAVVRAGAKKPKTPPKPIPIIAEDGWLFISW